jgi:hypothetical protein
LARDDKIDRALGLKAGGFFLGGGLLALAPIVLCPMRFHFGEDQPLHPRPEGLRELAVFGPDVVRTLGEGFAAGHGGILSRV